MYMAHMEYKMAWSNAIEPCLVNGVIYNAFMI